MVITMKKLLTSLMTVMLVLLVISPAAFASDMKEYRNEKDHYSISIPSDWEYRNNNKLSSDRTFSMFAISKSNEAIFINVSHPPQKAPQEVIPYLFDNITPADLENSLETIKNTATKDHPNLIYKDSGDIFINNHRLLWMQLIDTNIPQITTINYSIVHNDSICSIAYICPSSIYEKTLPQITESINSFRFDD